MKFFAVLLTTVAPGMLFAPVFGVRPLVAPLVAVAVAVVLVNRMAAVWRWAVAARAPMTLLTGLAAISVTTPPPPASDGARPGPTAFDVLADGAVNGWWRALDTTWPVRPDPAVVVFVPLLVLLCATVAVELFRRVRSPLPALVPGLLVLAAAQAYQAVESEVAAIAVGCGYAVAVGAVLLAGRPGVVLLATAGTLVAGGVAGFALDPLDRPALSLADTARPTTELTATSPLDLIAERLSRPDEPVFTSEVTVPVDRWRQAVLTRFDGTKWTDEARYRALGERLPAVSAAADRQAAIELHTELGPWLPAREGLRSVDGLAPLVDPATGVLLTTGPTTGLRYTLHWSAADPDDLAGASTAPVTLPPLVGLPPDFREVARAAVGDRPPTLATALALEDHFRTGFTLADDSTRVPVGHSYADLMSFLLKDKRGTSEQFATAYVVLARALGLPVRLAVGFRQSAEIDGLGRHVVRNRDVLAWPEIALTGRGWVALEPTGGASRPTATPLSSTQPTATPQHSGPTEVRSRTAPAVAAFLALSLLWVLGVPAAKRIRRLHRRRGTPAASTLGAWRETRDLLRDHGMPANTATTVRDLNRVTGDKALDLGTLADCVDEALWSSTPPPRSIADRAWHEYHAVRHVLAHRPIRERLKAALSTTSLTPLAAKQI